MEADETRLTPLAVTTATAATTATPAGRTLFPWPGFIDSKRTALEVFLVKHGDGFGGVFRRSHFHEGKSAGASGSSVLHNVDCNHRPCLRKVVLQIVLGCGEGKIPNK